MLDKTPKNNELYPFSYQIDGTTYMVGVHFSQTSNETMNDKLKRLILDDLQNNLKKATNILDK